MCISEKLSIHAISSNAVATNQQIFLSVILVRSAVTLSCQDIPVGRQQCSKTCMTSYSKKTRSKGHGGIKRNILS